MNFSNHPLNKQSIIDNRLNKLTNNIDKSIIDTKTQSLKDKLRDPSLGEGMVALAMSNLGEYQVDSIVDYVLRKSHTPGKAFVKICNNELRRKNGSTSSI